jgi:hypothetical protein
MCVAILIVVAVRIYLDEPSPSSPSAAPLAQENNDDTHILVDVDLPRGLRTQTERTFWGPFASRWGGHLSQRWGGPFLRRWDTPSAPVASLPSPFLPTISTSADYGTALPFRQIGMLTPQSTEKRDNLLPLMGREAFSRRGLWNYYAVSNQNNALQLPVSVKGKSGMSEYGVDELYTGDTVFVEGYDEVFKVTMYPRTGVSVLI